MRLQNPYLQATLPVTGAAMVGMGYVWAGLTVIGIGLIAIGLIMLVKGERDVK